MTVTTSAGAILAISATKPATFDKPGYLALAFTVVGEVTNIGDFGKEWEKVEHKPLANRGTIKKKGGYDEGAVPITVGLDEKDAGQILMQTAVDSDASYYFSLTRQTGDIYYFPALVMSWKRSIGERGSITSGSTSLEITNDSGTGLVKNLAP